MEEIFFKFFEAHLKFMVVVLGNIWLMFTGKKVEQGTGFYVRIIRVFREYKYSKGSQNKQLPSLDRKKGK